MRELEYLWKQAERQVANSRMTDPNKYTHLKIQDGTMSQEIAREFEKIVSGEPTKSEETQNTNDVNSEFGAGIENELTSDLNTAPDAMPDAITNDIDATPIDSEPEMTEGFNDESPEPDMVEGFDGSDDESDQVAHLG